MRGARSENTLISAPANKRVFSIRTPAILTCSLSAFRLAGSWAENKLISGGARRSFIYKKLYFLNLFPRPCGTKFNLLIFSARPRL
jgi:hypothetical protein